MSLDPNNPPNQEWISFHNLHRFSHPPGENPQGGSNINQAATNWYNAVARRMYQGLAVPSEIRGFPHNPKRPPPSRPGTMVIPTMRHPGPGGPSNPQGGAFAHGGFIKSHSFFK